MKNIFICDKNVSFADYHNKLVITKFPLGSIIGITDNTITLWNELSLQIKYLGYTHNSCDAAYPTMDKTMEELQIKWEDYLDKNK